jgi:hypothetical protein
MARSEMLGDGVSLQTDLATGLPLIEGYRVQLQQVVLNLILNTVEAMSSLDEEARELRISTTADASNGVLVAVRDTGPGLDPTVLNRLFEPFYITKPEGMGMGLAICHSIIEAHGGRLWASANAPRGGRVSVHPACRTGITPRRAGPNPAPPLDLMGPLGYGRYDGPRQKALRRSEPPAIFGLPEGSSSQAENSRNRSINREGNFGRFEPHSYDSDGRMIIYFVCTSAGDHDVRSCAPVFSTDG